MWITLLSEAVYNIDVQCVLLRKYMWLTTHYKPFLTLKVLYWNLFIRRFIYGGLKVGPKIVVSKQKSIVLYIENDHYGHFFYIIYVFLFGYNTVV